MPMNQLHPVYHGHSFQSGSRVDIDRMLPADIDDADLEELIESLSEPPKYQERISPVNMIIGNEIVRGKNWTEMMMKSYRVFLRMFGSIAFYIRQVLAEKFNERGMVPYMSCDFDPDNVHRMIELDYEQGENTYSSLMELYRTGVLAPAITVPFHVILPLLDNDFDRRICLRIGLLFYWEIVKEYHQYIRSVHGESRFIVTVWLPECGYSEKVLKILHEEFMAMAKADKIAEPHLVLLLDSQQAINVDNDVLMKSWNVVRVSDKDAVSVVFRDRSFSEWVTFSNPSVKKLIDRTIAKVDSELNVQEVDYCWGHYEDIEALTFSSKSALNFEQKVVKLSQLSYLAVSPDVFIRRKMNGKFGKAGYEPQVVKVKNNTGWTDWHTNISLGRWEGVLDSNSQFRLVDENRPYVRRSRTGKVQEIGPQCWKLALNRARTTITKLIKGDPETMKGGFLEVLADICGSKDPKITKRNVASFLVHFSQIQWREHFLQQDLSEADLNLQEIVDTHLLKDCRKRLSDEDYAMAGVAAQGYYFAIDSHRSDGTFWENLDQRAAYQDVVMLVLAISNYVHLLHWQDRAQEARKVVEVMKTELIDFGSAYVRYRLADYGVTEQEWKDSIKSAIDDTPMNLVERATRKVAARHLRPLGYRKDFTKEDENLTTNCGHIWSREIENTNYKWENKLFCGLREE